MKSIELPCKNCITSSICRYTFEPRFSSKHYEWFLSVYNRCSIFRTEYRKVKSSALIVPFLIRELSIKEQL